jgi:hypothetical protein
MSLKEAMFRNVDWIHLAQDKVWCQAFTNVGNGLPDFIVDLEFV